MDPLVGILTFISAYLDTSLGMGYGTALAPILLLMGYPPSAVVPGILLSQLLIDIESSISHHRLSNVDFRPRSNDLKVAGVLGILSVVGVLLSVKAALSIPREILTLYIGLLVTVVGLITVFRRSGGPFSWERILGVSFIAAFNKGISGGGYGPLLMGGQILSGVSPRSAVGITAFAEAMTCAAGFLAYLLLGNAMDWKLTVMLIISAVPAVPFAALTVKKVNESRLRRYTGIVITLLGLLTLLKMTS